VDAQAAKGEGQARLSVDHEDLSVENHAVTVGAGGLDDLQWGTRTRRLPSPQIAIEEVASQPQPTGPAALKGTEGGKQSAPYITEVLDLVLCDGLQAPAEELELQPTFVNLDALAVILDLGQ